MTKHPGEARLNEYLDGELDVRAEADVVEHLGECAGCRAEIEQLRAVVGSAAALRDSIEPRRDLWPDIDARIDAGAAVPLDAWRGRPDGGLWAHRYQLAAAAFVLVLAASTGTLLLVRDGEQPRAVAVTGAAVPSGVHLASVPGQADYVLAIQELDALLSEREGQIDPQTVEVVKRNLAIIDQAIRDAQRALASNPGDGELNRAVSTAYKTKINLMRRAVELPART